MKNANIISQTALWKILVTGFAVIALSLTGCDNGNGACSHDWQLSSTTSTCTAAGQDSFDCTKCTETKQEPGTALGHSNGICTRCGVLRLSGITVIDEEGSGVIDFGYIWDLNNWEYKPLSDLITGTPKAQIVNETMTIELDAPKTEAMILFSEICNNDDVTPDDVKGFYMYSFKCLDIFYYARLYNEDSESSLGFYYAENDVTVNDDYYDNITFKKGWNFFVYDYNENISVTQTFPSGFKVYIIYDPPPLPPIEE